MTKKVELPAERIPVKPAAPAQRRVQQVAFWSSLPVPTLHLHQRGWGPFGIACSTFGAHGELLPRLGAPP